MRLPLGGSKARRLAVAFPLWFPAPGFPRETALALREAAAAGVEVLAMDCAVTVDTMTVRSPVRVKL